MHCIKDADANRSCVVLRFGHLFPQEKLGCNLDLIRLSLACSASRYFLLDVSAENESRWWIKRNILLWMIIVEHPDGVTLPGVELQPPPLLFCNTLQVIIGPVPCFCPRIGLRNNETSSRLTFQNTAGTIDPQIVESVAVKVWQIRCFCHPSFEFGSSKKDTLDLCNLWSTFLFDFSIVLLRFISLLWSYLVVVLAPG